jgi:pimeloyl-ACP methyl ester carboxylesterase
MAFLSVFLITLGLGQLISTTWGLWGASLVGMSRLTGYGLGLGLLVLGALILPATWAVLWWTLPAGPLVVILLLWGGSFIVPPPHPNQIFSPEHPIHAGCQSVQIPDGDNFIPGLLLRPLRESQWAQIRAVSAGKYGSTEFEEEYPAVCIVPGAGDTKTFFKWRLVRAFLSEGFMVLTIDTPGHGDYGHRLLTYPDCLSTVPAALKFLRRQPDVTRVGLVGISLGGALTIQSFSSIEWAQKRRPNPHSALDCQIQSERKPLTKKTGAEAETEKLADALVVLETPVRLRYTRALFYREMWHTLYGSPVLSLLREVSVRQVWQMWRSGGYRSRHTVDELIELLNPLENISRLKAMPILLVYSRRDQVAPAEMGRAIQQVVPEAELIETEKASHVMLTLIPEVNRQVTGWLKERLGGEMAN